MGIPSYYRKIIQKYPGCLQKHVPEKIQALCFDFNCLIYHCLRSPTLSKYNSEDELEWENELIQEVIKAVKEIWIESGRPKQVFIAVDGVVPMAKIRQQRVRRFKSSWLQKHYGGSSEVWDKNAITPGTPFMNRLGDALELLCREKGVFWEASTSLISGEGEHKILEWLRKDKVVKGGNVVIYGLDADLILLSMLIGEEKSLPLWLMREKQEFGLDKKEEPNKQEYQFMNLEEFKTRVNVKGYEQVLNYICLMSLMGNDFLPHSVTHKLAGDGHEYIMKEVHYNTKIVTPEEKIDNKVFQDICKRWAMDEEEKMLEMIEKKEEQAKRGVLKDMPGYEGLPLTLKVESILVNSWNKELVDDWKEKYYTFARKNLYQEYVNGLQWILDYYTGKSVNLHWMFPSWLPPLWSDLATCHLEEVKQNNQQDLFIFASEQLAMVLPLESWHLIKDKKLQKVPLYAPEYFPENFSFFSFGHRWLWECEALIPPLTAGRLREIQQKIL
jgi:5'-3' exonuclease